MLEYHITVSLLNDKQFDFYVTASSISEAKRFGYSTAKGYMQQHNIYSHICNINVEELCEPRI